MFASRLTDIITHFTNSEIYVIADENYGACCIEDTAGFLLDADFIVNSFKGDVRVR
jgi:diphthamide biosynthesis enzyme Dph1/Dph2-like protein